MKPGIAVHPDVFISLLPGDFSISRAKIRIIPFISCCPDLQYLCFQYKHGTFTHFDFFGPVSPGLCFTDCIIQMAFKAGLS